jgi:hypothetical protein
MLSPKPHPTDLTRAHHQTPRTRLTHTAILTAAALATLTATAHAQPLPHDYAPTSTRWNGLSGLVQVAAQAGITLTLRDTLDYSALDPKRPLAIIYPTSPLDGDSFEQLLTEGGRVLLADDFGTSGALLPRFQIERVEARPQGLASQPTVGGNPALPTLRAQGRHPLLDGNVRVLVANHPAFLRSPLPAVIYYQDRIHGLVFDLTVGDGKLLVVADASLFINLMLEAGDNLTFTRNALRYLCDGLQPCDVDLYIGGFNQQGARRPPPDADDATSSARRDAQAKLTSLNDALSSLEKMVPERRLLRALIMVLSLGLGLLLLSMLPGQMPRFLTLRFRPPRAASPRSDFERHLDALSRQPGAHQVLPLSILREEFDALFWPALYTPGEAPAPEARYKPQRVREASARYAARVAPRDRAAQAKHQQRAEQLLLAIGRLPLRSQALIPEAAQTRWPEHHLPQLYQQAQQVLAPLAAPSPPP